MTAASGSFDRGNQLCVVIKPRLPLGLLLRFTGFGPFDSFGDGLPTRLEGIVALRAAARAYDALAGELLNSERQQNLDDGRVISYQDAAAQSAYFEARYQEAINRDPNLVRSAPRASSR
jgi:hypothetical protein